MPEACYPSCTRGAGYISYETDVLLRKLVDTLDQSETMSFTRTGHLNIAATYG